jgi:hypothetical protein
MVEKVTAERVADNGRAVQVDPMKPESKPPGMRRWIGLL